jgi:hypothetical protein
VDLLVRACRRTKTLTLFFIREIISKDRACTKQNTAHELQQKQARTAAETTRGNLRNIYSNCEAIYCRKPEMSQLCEYLSVSKAVSGVGKILALYSAGSGFESGT